MTRKKLFLGTVAVDHRDNKGNISTVSGEDVYISKHSWDCGWYWGMGYIGNRRTHTHFNAVFLTTEHNVKNIFTNTKLTQDDWWVLRDLFIQAYALKKSAEVYRYGGRQITVKDITDVIEDKEMEQRVNKDLEKVLDTIWDYLEKVL